jgi:hypothetical protein
MEIGYILSAVFCIAGIWSINMFGIRDAKRIGKDLSK